MPGRRARRAIVALAFVALASVRGYSAAPAVAADVEPVASLPIVFVPLDDRPVTYQLPIMLGRIAGQPVVTPPREMLGNYLRPGDPEALAAWLGGNATRRISALVASTDMVAYGGLVASRIPGVSATEAIGRVGALAALGPERGIPFVGAFGTIMRLAPTGVPRLGLATDYYATGQTVDDLQAYANLPDPPARAADVARAAHLRTLVGPATLGTYLETRARNRDVDRWALWFAGQGGYDRIVIGQDDAGPQGLHLKDVAALEREARLVAGVRASIEPGADELGMVMLARVFARNAGWKPTVSVVYSRADGGATVDHLEYVPIDTTIGEIVRACGASRVASGGDVRLYVRVAETTDADEMAFEDRLASDVGAGASVAVADLTFLHGGPGPEQRELTDALIAHGFAGKIDAFASWNTDANTVGTTLPEAIAVGAGRRTGTYDRRAHEEFLLDRYVDDYAFHQFVRPDLNEALRARGIDTTLLAPDVAAQASHDNRAALWPYALDLLARIFPDERDAGLTITLPWDRTFETKIDVRLTPPANPPPAASSK